MFKKSITVILAFAFLLSMITLAPIGANAGVFVDGNFNLTADSNIFVRYSATEWRVFSGDNMIKTPNHPTKGYIQANGTTMPLCVIGDYNTGASQIIPATASNTEFLDPAGVGFAGGDKFLTTGSSGYCAVGVVDTSLQKAVILLDDGTVKTVSYQGTAPISGEVHSFTKNSGDTYEFVHNIGLAPGNANTVAAWDFNSYINPQKLYMGNNYNLTNSSTIFVRYSATEWRVFKGNNMIKNSGNASKGYMKTSSGNMEIGVVGNYDTGTGQIIPATASNTKFLDSSGAGFASGDKNLDGVVSAGVCAVGTVNTTAQSAIILLDDGTIKTVPYQGSAPVSGEVHNFKKYYNGKYELIQAGLMPNYANSSAAWDFNSYTSPQRLYMGNNYTLTTNSAIFVRYSATEWRVFKGNDIIKKPGNASKGYFNTTDTNLNFCLVGNYDTGAHQIIPATAANTRFLDSADVGFASGDKFLTTPTSGYCAVGLVDTATQKAIILPDDGNIQTVTYQGTAPVSGEVHSFTKTSADIYSFTQTGLSPNYANSSAR